jgi:hypothetical protein
LFFARATQLRTIEVNGTGGVARLGDVGCSSGGGVSRQ